MTTLKEPLERLLEHVREQIKQINNKAKVYLSNLEGEALKNVFIVEKLNQLHDDLNKLETHESGLLMELRRPILTEVSFQQVHEILANFSKLLRKAEPEMQKDLLHSIINKITVNQGSNPEEISIKEIELFFDASLQNDEFVLTCDTVPPAQS